MRKLGGLILLFIALTTFPGCGGGGGDNGSTSTTGHASSSTTGTTGTSSTGSSSSTSSSTGSTGSQQSSFAIHGTTPNAMALDGNGHVWVTTTTDTEEYDGQGNNIINNSQGGTGIAIDANGTPWVATSQGLNQVNPSTGAGEAFPGNNDIATSAGPVAIDHAGNIWGASTITGQVFELSSNGTQQNVFSVVPAPSTAGGMGIDANGNLWVCSNDGFLREVSSGGSIMQSINLGGDPQNLAIDQNGSVWVTDHQNNVVDEISSAGASLGQFAVGNSPTGIAIDQAGNVFVANGGDGNIDILTPRGNIVNMVTLSPISGTAASPQPIGLAIDASGTLWVLDTAFSGIHQITSAAQGPQFFPYSGPNMPWGSGLNGF